jgi:hypothetical protein
VLQALRSDFRGVSVWRRGAGAAGTIQTKETLSRFFPRPRTSPHGPVSGLKMRQEQGPREHMSELGSRVASLKARPVTAMVTLATTACRATAPSKWGCGLEGRRGVSSRLLSEDRASTGRGSP